MTEQTCLRKKLESAYNRVIAFEILVNGYRIFNIVLQRYRKLHHSLHGSAELL